MIPISIACRFWSKARPALYVANLPGDGGVDWGYTADRERAIPLSLFWQRRFSADCRRVGAFARLFDVAPSVSGCNDAPTTKQGNAENSL